MLPATSTCANLTNDIEIGFESVPCVIARHLFLSKHFPLHHSQSPLHQSPPCPCVQASQLFALCPPQLTWEELEDVTAPVSGVGQQVRDRSISTPGTPGTKAGLWEKFVWKKGFVPLFLVEKKSLSLPFYFFRKKVFAPFFSVRKSLPPYFSEKSLYPLIFSEKKSVPSYFFRKKVFAPLFLSKESFRHGWIFSFGWFSTHLFSWFCSRHTSHTCNVP